MFQSQGEVTAGQYSVRELPLLEGERIEGQFVPNSGLITNTPQKGQLLVLTNHRVISFVQSDGHKETFLASLEELKGVSVKASVRGVKDLLQGLALILVGILGYFIIGYMLERVTIASALGAAIMFVGVFFLAKFFFWEEEGNITFQGGSWELSFPYRSRRASADVYKLVNRFFQLKLSNNTHSPHLPEQRPEANPPGAPPFSSPPGLLL